MSIVISVNGSTPGDGFLIAPDNGIAFAVPLNLSTNDGSTVSAMIDAKRASNRPRNCTCRLLIAVNLKVAVAAPTWTLITASSRDALTAVAKI